MTEALLTILFAAVAAIGCFQVFADDRRQEAKGTGLYLVIMGTLLVAQIMFGSSS